MDYYHQYNKYKKKYLQLRQNQKITEFSPALISNFEIKNPVNIDGFGIIENYLTEQHEANLINLINKQKWVVDYQRRLQYYNYRNELVEPYDLIPIPNPIPSFLNELIDQMINDKIIHTRPDQIIVNEFLAGQGLKPHFDRKDYFKDLIVGISLGSGTVMNFQKLSEKKELYLPRRSLYWLSGDARYKWKHGIPPRKYDPINGIKIPRTTRTSITFRYVISDKVKYENIVYPHDPLIVY